MKPQTRITRWWTYPPNEQNIILTIDRVTYLSLMPGWSHQLWLEAWQLTKPQGSLNQDFWYHNLISMDKHGVNPRTGVAGKNEWRLWEFPTDRHRRPYNTDSIYKVWQFTTDLGYNSCVCQNSVKTHQGPENPMELSWKHLVWERLENILDTAKACIALLTYGLLSFYWKK